MKLLPTLASMLLAAAAQAAPSGHGPGHAHDALMQLANEYVQTSARLFPTQATSLGITQYDGVFEEPSERNRAAYVAQLQAWRARLRGIVAADAPLALVDRDDAQLLDSQLAQNLNALRIYQRDRKDYAGGAVNVLNVIFEQLQFLPVAGRDGTTGADVDRAWADIVSRLAAAPAYIEASQRLATHPGHLYGVVGSQALDGAPGLFNGPLSAAAAAHYGADDAALRRFAHARDAALAALAATRAYVDAHVASWPENYAPGRQAYDRMLREELLLPFTASDLERMAQEQLARGWTGEAWLAARAAHEHRQFGASSGGGMAPEGPALIGYYRERIAELRDFVAAHDLVTVPDWLGQMQVQETPKFMQPTLPGASMIAPRLFDTGTTGFYFITPPVSLQEAAANLDINEDFDRDRILGTAAHEAMPGHFLQLSIARRHLDFVRRISGYTSFIEGWAFYGEELFVQLGLYGDHLDGPLDIVRWERVRGARVLADVRLATGEWTVQQAAEFYARETSFSPAAAAAQVAAIATEPGHYIAYTLGRLQIEQLLSQYWQKTAGRGSLHDFHDRLLSYGSIPLSILGPELLADLDKPVEAVRAAANY